MTSRFGKRPASLIALDLSVTTRDLRQHRPHLKPMDNGFIESFNGEFRDECLNEHRFVDLDEARQAIEARRVAYNEERPHSTEVLELSARMPIEVLLGPRNESKFLLKRLALKHLPHEVVLRPKKGFELPIAEWLRGPWLGAVRRLVLDPRALARGYFRREYIEHVLARHAAGADHRHRLWCLLWLELWHLMFIDNTLKPTDTLSLG